MNWTAISSHIKSMDYRDFLRTPYWKTISAHTKYRAGYRCQLCNGRMRLVTHHRDYSIHGHEHAHMNELTVLCNDCHQKFHYSANDRSSEILMRHSSLHNHSMQAFSDPLKAHARKSILIVLGLIVLIAAYSLVS